MVPRAKLSIHVISNPVLSGEKSAVAVLSCKSRFLSSFEMTVVFFLKVVLWSTGHRYFLKIKSARFNRLENNFRRPASSIYLRARQAAFSSGSTVKRIPRDLSSAIKVFMVGFPFGDKARYRLSR